MLLFITTVSYVFVIGDSGDKQQNRFRSAYFTKYHTCQAPVVQGAFDSLFARFHCTITRLTFIQEYDELITSKK